MNPCTRANAVLAALRMGPKTIAELCQNFGVPDPHNVIYILRCRGYDIRTRPIEGTRRVAYTLCED